MSARAEGTPCYSRIVLSGPPGFGGTTVGRHQLLLACDIDVARLAAAARVLGKCRKTRILFRRFHSRRSRRATLTGMGFQTRRIEANGISYHLIDEGGQGPAVL